MNEVLEELNMTREEALKELKRLYYDMSVCTSELTQQAISDEIGHYEGALEEE